MDDAVPADDHLLAATALPPRRKGGRPATPLPPAAPGFVEGKHKMLGTVDMDATKKKSASPERHVPKITMGDGKHPKVGLKVLVRDGREAEIVEQFQTYSRVAFADGTKTTVPTIHLNSATPVRRARPQAQA